MVQKREHWPETGEHFNDQCLSHIETIQLTFRANQLAGFYKGGTLVVKGLNEYLNILPIETPTATYQFFI